MYGKAQKLFYILAGFLLLTGFFVLKPNSSVEITSLQNEIKHEFTVAWIQTIGDQPYFDDLYVVVDGVFNFYDSAAIETIALLDPKGADDDMIQVFAQVYHEFKLALIHHPNVAANQPEQPPIDLAHFMKEPALSNIVPEPEDLVVKMAGSVSGTLLDEEAVNQDRPWVTIRDNFTGQLYCMAVYNGEVNKYLGPCKYDYE